jgi:hypothetical protein
MPLIDLALLSDRAFMRGLVAVFCFFFANLSFYLVMTIYMQKGLQIPPLEAGLVFLPLALTFVIASRHSGIRAKHRGTLVLIEGCAVQIVGIAALAAVVAWIETPSPLLLALVLTVFGYGQGARDGAAVERGALDGKAGQRRRGLRDVWHDGANRQRGRRRRDRSGVLRNRIGRIGAAGIAGRRQRCLRCRSSPAPHF